jgi:hypothetical protein
VRAQIDPKMLNFNGDELQKPIVAVDDLLGCAAPKLIQFALQNGKRPRTVYLSEIWYKAGTPHAPCPMPYTLTGRLSILAIGAAWQFLPCFAAIRTTIRKRQWADPRGGKAWASW